MINLILILLTIGISLPTLADNKQLITQSLAINYNNQIPKDYENSPAFLVQYFVPTSWAQIISDSSIQTSWNHLVEDPKHPNMIRVFIHPFDQISAKKIESALKAEGLPHKPSKFEIPFLLTESRSLYPVSTDTRSAPASPRLSMSNGFGKWNGREDDVDAFGNFFGTEYYKMISSKQAEFAIYASRVIQEKLQGTRGDFFEIQPDRMVVSIKSPDRSVDMGETFRDITSVIQKDFLAVPGFVQQTLDGGLLLAYANGFDSTYEYLMQAESQVRGRALAEFYIRTGFVHSSPHSQNFLLQADNQFRLTGKLLIRDLADLIPTYDSRLADPKMASLFENFEDAREALHKNLDGGSEHFVFRHSFFKGSDDEMALTSEQKQKVELETSKAFIETLSAYSGVSAEEIQRIVHYDFSDVNGNYGMTFFKRNSSTWKQILSGINDRLQLGARIELKDSIKPKDIFEGQKDLSSFFSRIIAKSLRKQSFTTSELSFISNLWKNNEKYNFSNEEIIKLSNIMILTRTAPSSELFRIYSVLKDKNMKNKLLENILVSDSADLKSVFLKQIIKKYSPTKAEDYYFEKAELKSFINTLASSSKSVNTLTPDLLEAIYFAFSSVENPEYKGSNSITFMKLFEKLGISQAVKTDLQLWKKQYQSDSWIVEKILQSKVVNTKFSCLKNY